MGTGRKLEVETNPDGTEPRSRAARVAPSLGSEGRVASFESFFRFKPGQIRFVSPAARGILMKAT